MITIKFNTTDHEANTLLTKYIGNNKSGWEIKGEIQSDYCEWVNEFEATHLKYGKVWGDFEKEVYADTKEGYDNFIKNHPPECWDYWDI